MLATTIFGALGKAAIGKATSKGFELLKAKKAKLEIAEIGASAIEAGVSAAPALADDLRTESFVSGAFVPVLETIVNDPSKLPDPDGLARQFVEMFVERFAEASSVDEVLQRIFQTERSQLVAAFV